MSDSRQKHIYKISSFENITFIVDTWMDYNELFFQHIAVDIKLDFVFTVKNKTQRAYCPRRRMEIRYKLVGRCKRQSGAADLSGKIG